MFKTIICILAFGFLSITYAQVGDKESTPRPVSSSQFPKPIDGFPLLDLKLTVFPTELTDLERIRKLMKDESREVFQNYFSLYQKERRIPYDAEFVNSKIKDYHNFIDEFQTKAMLEQMYTPMNIRNHLIRMSGIAAQNFYFKRHAESQVAIVELQTEIKQLKEKSGTPITKEKFIYFPPKNLYDALALVSIPLLIIGITFKNKKKSS